jgi:hypothetical protein
MVILSIQSNELDAVVYEEKIAIKFETKLFTKKMDGIIFGRHDLTRDRVRRVIMEFCCIYCYKNIKYRYSANNPVKTNCILEVCTVLHVY